MGLVMHAWYLPTMGVKGLVPIWKVQRWGLPCPQSLLIRSVDIGNAEPIDPSSITYFPTTFTTIMTWWVR